MVNCRTVQTSNHATYKKAPPRPLFAYNRRKFDEDEFKERKTPEFAEEVPLVYLHMFLNVVVKEKKY